MIRLDEIHRELIIEKETPQGIHQRIALIYTPKIDTDPKEFSRGFHAMISARTPDGGFAYWGTWTSEDSLEHCRKCEKPLTSNQRFFDPIEGFYSVERAIAGLIAHTRRYEWHLIYKSSK